MERYISERLLIQTLLNLEIEGPYLRRSIANRMNEMLHSEIPLIIHSLPGIYMDSTGKKIGL